MTKVDVRVKKGRVPYRESFLAALKKLGAGDKIFVNSKVLQDELGWDAEKYKRVRELLINENAITTTRGGPGGLISITNPKETTALNAMISYCHADEAIKIELEKHLSALKRMKLVSVWTDRKISPGQNWETQISANLDSSSIIILLVSADFINSEYCYGIEMERAMERHDAKQAVVIPVLIRSCMWDFAPFAKIQALPKDMRAVSSWSDKDAAFVNIAEGVMAAAKGILNAE